MFNIGEYAVCPGNGVGQVVDIVEEEFGGCKAKFYVVKIIPNGMIVRIPTASKEKIRPLVSENEVEGVFEVLKNHDVEVDTSTWNRRNRDYSAKVSTGSLIEIAEVLRELFLLKQRKVLSSGEKNMLNQCCSLMVLEISISEGKDTGSVQSAIENCFPA